MRLLTLILLVACADLYVRAATTWAHTGILWSRHPTLIAWLSRGSRSTVPFATILNVGPHGPVS
jgi:hypothetical protein